MEPELAEKLLKEVKLKAVTSGGKGGQNVNKVATRVELYFNIGDSVILNQEQKELLLKTLANKISEEQVLRITSSEGRTQLSNRETVLKKFMKLITASLKVPVKRKATKVPAASKEERLREKKIKADIKKLRSKP